MLVELLLGARVFAFLEQVFGLVALAPRVGERERAILAVSVRADGVGFLAAVEAVDHPPELGGGVAGPALVRRDEEIETAAGHIGNLGGAPRALVEFRSGGAAVDVGPDLLGVGARAIVLVGHLLNSLRSDSEVAVNVCSPDTNKNTNKSDGWDRMRTNGDEHRCTRKGLIFKGFRALRGRLRTLWNGLEQPSWCPGRNRKTPCGSTAYLRLYDDVLSRATEGFPALC